MATTIEHFVKDLGITALVHFTREENLGSILTQGLIRRDILQHQGGVTFNDAYRLDRTSAICLSIGFPNYKMFYGLRQSNVHQKWVVLGVDPCVLWTLPCAFCVANAASSVVTSVPLDERMTLNALRAMYQDWPDKPRAGLALPASYPTHPQAEVLMLNGVPKTHILGVMAEDKAHQQQLQSRHQDAKIGVCAPLFGARRDYAHWR